MKKIQIFFKKNDFFILIFHFLCYNIIMKLKWRYIYEKIRDSVQDFPLDAKFTSERKLAEKHNVHRLTIKKAIDQLIDEGYLYRVKKRGTHVSKQHFYSEKYGNASTQGDNFNVSDFEVVKHPELFEAIHYKKKTYSDINLVKVEEFFLRSDIFNIDLLQKNREFVTSSLFEFIDAMEIAYIAYAKKEVKTFTTNGKKYIMIKNDIYNGKNEQIAALTVIQPLNDFEIKLLDFSVQSKVQIHPDDEK